MQYQYHCIIMLHACRTSPLPSRKNTTGGGRVDYKCIEAGPTRSQDLLQSGQTTGLKLGQVVKITGGDVRVDYLPNLRSKLGQVVNTTGGGVKFGPSTTSSNLAQAVHTNRGVSVDYQAFFNLRHVVNRSYSELNSVLFYRTWAKSYLVKHYWRRSY